jgi:peptidoglycan/xylan/chitin deacetylase (PgdA/CDA1 family)
VPKDAPSLGGTPSPRATPPTSTAAAPVSASLITHGPRSRKRIALTFDADMTPGVLRGLRAGTVKSWYDASIVEQLRSSGTPATIFLTGLWTQAYPEVVRSFAADPLFELGNHTVDHAAWKLPCYQLAGVTSDDGKRRELRDAAAEIRAVAGAAPRWFRFPGGCETDADLKLVASEGEQPVGWDVNSGDAFQPNPAVVISSVLNTTRPGSIIVMHLMGAPNAPATSRALARILPELRNRGFEFVRLSTLLES